MFLSTMPQQRGSDFGGMLRCRWSRKTEVPNDFRPQLVLKRMPWNSVWSGSFAINALLAWRCLGTCDLWITRRLRLKRCICQGCYFASNELHAVYQNRFEHSESCLKTHPDRMLWNRILPHLRLYHASLVKETQLQTRTLSAKTKT